MKAAKKQPTRSAAKPAAPRAVEDYIAGIPEPNRKLFATLRAAVSSVMPADAVEVISYGIPAFRRKRILVWFAAFANHCSLFPTASVIEAFAGELAGFTVSKGTVQFPLDKPLAAALVKKLVKARIAHDKKLP
jgi:uncharacterized protein YdhG (YjbR/CyaY superfamily)